MSDAELLPQTETDLDVFVERVIQTFKLPGGDDTYDAIATMIMHMPHTRAYERIEYFGEGVQKQLANRAAYNRLREIAERRKAADAEKEAEQKKQAELTLVPVEAPSASGSESV